ncbi:MAG: MFS transporter [Gemmatimonadota bacterium]
MRPPRPVLLISLATATSLLGDQMLYSVLPTYYAQLGLVPYQVGLLLSVNRFVRLLTNHLAEAACRRYSPALLMAAALAGGAGLTATYALSTAFPVLLGARICWGLCWSFIRQIGLLTVVDGSAEAHIGQVMGYYSGISRLGSITGNLVGALGHDLVGFGAILGIFALVSLLGTPLGPWARRGLRRRSALPGAAPRPGRAGSPLLVSGFVSGCVGQGLLAATLGLVLAETVGESLSVAGQTVGVATLTGLLLASRWVADLGAPIIGAVSDRWGRRDAGAAFFGLGSLALAGAGMASGPFQIAALVFLFYAAATGVNVTLTAQAGLRGSRAVAAYVTASDLGSAVGPNLGWLAPQLGLPAQAIFALGCGLYAMGGAAAWMALERRGGGRRPAAPVAGPNL